MKMVVNFVVKVKANMGEEEIDKSKKYELYVFLVYVEEAPCGTYLHIHMEQRRHHRGRGENEEVGRNLDGSFHKQKIHI